ncbi:zinc finger CCCH domain-containing protein 10-like [Haliotis cracherodii]|uniref:zinc finger CCCH domain-containing protein 10-like n=1 Tax=Haliotis rufescens TaxID=6454 RepID=UPI001EB016FC|nr:zinc finger CCCH domain-containing protein 10-like [Haliotis rufescens]XP_046326007.1 zinc finger CCCH domain-containing protein 10-like [Haliotis rufescens]XP_046326008.1 zinc finger CCCH domain-containing protein 10-like [Haliotis rufescens]XP_046326009.1 zinc finger CCCH domain-containing protein 10-like [Haliotis rufescens]XP_046326010.1 zinc finger CCCH domain-containing protein 10-like [Haliotis rufescens]XP_046326011.1 zinc finger CCCH domain-containing protein 10-like [Haliotis rufe
MNDFIVSRNISQLTKFEFVCNQTGNMAFMSDNSDSGSEDMRYNGTSKHMNGKEENSICRDFLRNVCKRGKRCRYRHPTINEAKDLGKKQEFTFCHDFQNTGCRRASCKFLHCTREEEEYYLQTAQLPVRLQQQAALGVGSVAHSLPILKGEVPICKDYLKRECKRGAKCKYRHLSGQEYDFEMRKTDIRTPRVLPFNNYENDSYDRFEYGHGPLKRRRLDSEGYGNYIDGRYPPPMRSLSVQMLEDENNMLRRKVEELKKQVADLTATNEVLLEQNARYRVSKSTAIMTPAVTVAGTGATLNHLSTSLSQQIALNSEMATQHALQTAQRFAREMVHAPNQSALAAQSINPSVTLNPSTMVSLTPASLQQNPLQGAGTITQSIPQNLAGQSASLVSYPIVSQSIRVAGVPSSMAH